MLKLYSQIKGIEGSNGEIVVKIKEELGIDSDTFIPQSKVQKSVPSEEEQLVVDEMILHPYKNCTFDLMEQLECERTTIYKLRARAVKKLYRLYFGVGE